jgi:hypothetical protein
MLDEKFFNQRIKLPDIAETVQLHEHLPRITAV